MADEVCPDCENATYFLNKYFGEVSHVLHVNEREYATITGCASILAKHDGTGYRMARNHMDLLHPTMGVSALFDRGDLTVARRLWNQKADYCMS